MPAGLEVTVPVPPPVRATVTAKLCRVKLALTLSAPLTVTVQVVPVVVSQPVQAPNDEPALGVAVRVTEVPYRKLSLQSPPQLMPPGTELTVPAPAPVLPAVRVKLCRSKVALMFLAAVTVTVQVAPET